MRHRLETIANWIGFTIVLGGLVLVAREYPLASTLILVLTAIGILLLTAWYDYDYWKVKFLRWRHRDVLSTAATIATPHIDRLAHEMAKVLMWDGRSDYLWEPWIKLSREFVATIVIPRLSPEQQRIVADCGPILSEEIRSGASARVFERAQRLGLVL
jgi:hypothetical protein